jgi:hypothetical protein
MDDKGDSAMNLSGWLPARVAWHESGPHVEWTLLGSQRLVDPFFEQTLQRQMMHPFHQLFRRSVSMDEVVEWTGAHPSAPLRGLIFHMSRSGSTLLTQQLAALERNIVASEPAPLDAILRVHLYRPGISRETQVQWVRAMAAALGQPRAGEQALYIKLDCWHVHQMDLVREAFPTVPWVFLYRDPVEVMVSQERMPAAWAIPGMLHPLALQLQWSDWDPSQTDVYRARALANICEGGLKAVQDDPGGLLVNYSELPDAMYGRLLGHFGLTQEDIPAMQQRAQRSAKSPTESFSSDRESKQAEALDRLRAVVAEHLQPVYDQLEAERLRQIGM